MTANGTVKIGDLNRAEVVRNGRGACKLKARGKWRSPEEYRFDEMTQKSDVYSTGLVIWSILTGLTPLKDVPVEKALQLCIASVGTWVPSPPYVPVFPKPCWQPIVHQSAVPSPITAYHC
ncbi:hypothetical protein CYMTET_33715 [Cymbomonas tetramitiformis]|uniref:Protein kinase domain-containing protein n=1 Tax=Cymbomonas tetramitiformis TaxID=36881 RepID=A0AAE0FCQ6_9CHLO|nr:hypothetical protein CYMTET_33715 [Cymbomonas tetramitiformis]